MWKTSFHKNVFCQIFHKNNFSEKLDKKTIGEAKSFFKTNFNRLLLAVANIS